MAFSAPGGTWLTRAPLVATNAAARLNIPTYVATNDECTHPSVVDFGAGNTWNGYRYWMAMTPYTNTDSHYENPSIVVSNDNSTWVVPPGLTNPVDPDPGAPTKWNADTDLVYDEENDRLVMYWKHQDTSLSPSPTMRVMYSTSTDGVTWAAEQVCIAYSTAGVISTTCVKRGSDWKMWGVSGDSTVQTNYIEMRTSADGITWGSPQAVGGEWRCVPWHLGCVWDEVLQQYIMIISGWPTGLDHRSTRLWLSSSPDGKSWATPTQMLMPQGASGAWDDYKIYRACGTIEGRTLRIWYSAQGTSSTGPWYIGYTEVTLPS